MSANSIRVNIFAPLAKLKVSKPILKSLSSICFISWIKISFVMRSFLFSRLLIIAINESKIVYKQVWDSSWWRAHLSGFKALSLKLYSKIRAASFLIFSSESEISKFSKKLKISSFFRPVFSKLSPILLKIWRLS